MNDESRGYDAPEANRSTTAGIESQPCDLDISSSSNANGEVELLGLGDPLDTTGIISDVAEFEQFMQSTLPESETAQSSGTARARGRRVNTETQHTRRNSSPGPYVDDAWARSQSPVGSVYSDSGRLPIPDLWSGYTVPQTGEMKISGFDSSENLHYLDSKPTEPTSYRLLESECPQPCCDLCSQESRFCHHPLDAPDVVQVFAPLYHYFTLFRSEIRLLRIDPGTFDVPLICALKRVMIRKIKSSVLSFQALSYAWGNGAADHFITLYDLGETDRSDFGEDGLDESQAPRRLLPVRENLLHALRRIRNEKEYVWVWVDAICIDQNDQDDKSRQLPNMPDIYSHAWNVIVWLGEEEQHPNESDLAVALVPELLNLDRIDSFLASSVTVDLWLYEAWQAFGNLLQRPWFSRRWVIQELAFARKVSVRLKHHVLSWVDFIDAVDVYSRHSMNKSWKVHGHVLPKTAGKTECGRAMALLELSRNIFRKGTGPELDIQAKLQSLESLVLLASSFEVSEVRDTIYALLCLSNDTSTGLDWRGFASHQQSDIKSDYSRHPVDLFSEFVQYSVKKSNSLDILCRPWASWPNRSINKPYLERYLPGWIRVASFAGRSPLERVRRSEVLLGPPGRPIYNASRGIPAEKVTISVIGGLLLTKGVLIGRISCTSSIMSDEVIEIDALKAIGWQGKIENCFEERFWRTLVANRDTSGQAAPAWYRRACASAFSTPGRIDSDLFLKERDDDSSLPNLVKEYMKRVGQVVDGRRSFECQYSDQIPHCILHEGQHVVGIGPLDTKDGYCVAILFGCSVPVVVKRVIFPEDTGHEYQIIGPCYVHGYMEGEAFSGLTGQQIEAISKYFIIY